MKRTIYIILSCALASCLMLSCQKKEANDVSPSTEGSLIEIYKALAPKPEIITMNAEAGGIFSSKNGARYFFSFNSLQKMNGDSVLGEVQVTLLECLTRSDMIFSRILPVSNGIPVVPTGGERVVMISKGGEQLIFKKDMSFGMNLPFTVFPPVKPDFFRGKYFADSSDMTTTNWVISNDSATGGNVFFVLKDTISVNSFSPGLCMAGKLLSNPDFQSVTVTITGIPGSYTNNLCVYASLDTLNSVMLLGKSNYNKLPDVAIPKRPAHLIVMAVVKNQFYGGISSSITPENGLSYNVNLTAADPVVFKAQIDSLQ